MQRLAKEMNYSETTFFKQKISERGYNVRIFTPEQELPFAGHPTLELHCNKKSSTNQLKRLS